MKIPEELRGYIAEKVIGNDLPKRKDLKIIARCKRCGLERQTNAFDFLNGKVFCRSCIQKIKNENGEYDYSYRKSKEYRKNMSNSIKKSKKYKETKKLRSDGAKKYWENVRGYKIEDVKNEWDLYKSKVYLETEKVYRKYKNIINPNNLVRGRGKDKYHIDHKFSVLEGFKNNIPVYIICHYSNLEMLLEKDNISKDCKCSVSIDDLFKGVFESSGGIS